MRDFPEGFYADRWLDWMSADPPVRERAFLPLASTRLDPRFLARLQGPDTDIRRHAVPILLSSLKARK